VKIIIKKLIELYVYIKLNIKIFQHEHLNQTVE